MNNLAKEVIGNLFGITRPNEVQIILDPKVTRTRPIEIGEYISIEYPGEVLDEEVIALITKIELFNESIPDSLMKSPESFEKLGRLGDFSTGEVLLANARIIGYFSEKDKMMISPRFPSVPGAKVYRSNIEILKKVFSAGHVKIGHLRAHKEVEVKVNVNELIRRHTCILAITGAGKGNTVAVLSTRILEHNGSVIIIDPHEEYPKLKELKKDQVAVFTPLKDPSIGYLPIRFKWNNFSTDEIFEILEIRSDATNQQAVIREILEKLEGTDWDMDSFQIAMDQIIEEYSASEDDDEEVKEESSKKKKKTKTKTSKKRLTMFKENKMVILDRIKALKGSEIFHKTDETPIFAKLGPCLVKPGQITVISVSNLPLRVQQVVVARLAKKIYEAGVAWRRNLDKVKLPCPTLLVIEEAHNFIPSKGNAKSLPSLTRIAAEGRKFGVGLCVVSQRPGKVDSNVLSQCNSQIILRIVNPNDQSQIANSAEAMSEDLLSDLPALNKGEAVIIGSCLLIPALVKIDKFEGELGGDDIDIISEWKEWLSGGKYDKISSTGISEKTKDLKGPDYKSNKDIPRERW